MEIALLCIGISALVTGRFRLSANRVVYGGTARVLGLIALMPFPLAFCGGFCVGFQQGLQGKTSTDPESQPILIAFEVGSVVVCSVLVYTLGWFVASAPGQVGQSQAQQAGIIRSCIPPGQSEWLRQQESIQPTVQLRTAALAGYGTPRAVEVAAPPKSGRQSLGVATWVVLLIVGFGVMQYMLRKTPAPVVSADDDAAPANAAPAAAGARQDRPKEAADWSAQ